jgi:predicted nuclease of predicted toxin-antitoxin system
MKRVLLDQGLPFRTIGILRQNGWDAIHVSEIGMSEAEDRAILEHAGRESRIASSWTGISHKLSRLLRRSFLPSF